MNERIRELAEQADIVFGHYNNNEVICSAIDINKFAELIVKECTDTIENLSPGYIDYRNQIEDAFRIASIVEIKNRFGIK